MLKPTHRSGPALLVGCLALAPAAAWAHAHHDHDTDRTTADDDHAVPILQPAQPSNDAQRRGRPEPMEAIDLPAPEVSITIEGDHRVIRANGLPTHDTGDFPNRGNPNALRPQEHEYRVPAEPTWNDEPTVARPEFGIALNGVIFDSGTGEFWTPDNDRAFGGGSPWNYEALTGGIPLGLDQNHAHVQPTGKYHYHGIPTGLLDARTDADHPGMVHLGWAFDGYPIYGPLGYDDPNDPNSQLRALRSSYRVKDGQRPTPPDGPGDDYDGTYGLDFEYVEGLGDLDACNGRFGVTPEFPDGTYYYVVTAEFPAVPRMWHGTPDPSIQQRGQRGPGGPGGERPRGGPDGERRPRGERPRRGPRGERPDGPPPRRR